jgi:hypothetical protein
LDATAGSCAPAEYRLPNHVPLKVVEDIARFVKKL